MKYFSAKVQNLRKNLKKRKIKLKTFPSFLGLKVHGKDGSEKTIIPHIEAGTYPGMYDVY